MRRARAEELARKWQSGEALKGARLSEKAALKMSETAAGLLLALALPETEDLSAQEALSDGALCERVKPLFRAGLRASERVGGRQADEAVFFKKALAAERAARLQGASSEGIDALWELALQEEIALGHHACGQAGPVGIWRADLAGLNAREGLSARLGWALLSQELSEALDPQAELAWLTGGWASMASRACVFARLLSEALAKRSETGDTGWAGEREQALAEALERLAAVAASWESGAGAEPMDGPEQAAARSLAAGEDPEIQQLRAEWALSRAPRQAGQAAPAARETSIPEETRSQAKKALPLCSGLVGLVKRARANPPSVKARAPNVKTRAVG